MQTVRLRWKGPFLWSSSRKPTFFDRPEGQLKGLYLWAIKRPGAYLIAGFGITRRTFVSRFVFHTRSYFDGRYAVCDSRLILRGRRKDVWPGFWWGREAWKNPGSHARRISSIAPHAASLLAHFRIFVAPVSTRSRTPERIEAAMYDLLRSEPRRAGLLIEDGMQVSRRRPGERPLSIRISAPTQFLGLPWTFIAYAPLSN